LSFVSKSKRVARRATSRVVAVAIVALTTMGATSRASAELMRPNVPTLTWGAGISGWMPPHEVRFASATRVGIVWTPSFSAFSIGLAGQGALRSVTQVTLAPALASRSEPWSLCIGPTCPGRARSSSDANGDPDASMKAGSMRLINGIGPIAVTALKLFSSPVATAAHPVAMRVSPMFAFGGGGLEMRCAWW
jgi:hypothetical protein